MLDRFAEQLRKARLKKGISLQQIAAKTRIDIKFLEAIDNGNFGFLPDLYVKAFLRQYAKSVDLDENETIKKYEDALAGKFIEDDEPKSLLEQKIETRPEEPELPKEKQTPVFDSSPAVEKPKAKPDDLNKKLRLLIYVSGAILVGVIIYFALSNRSSTIVVEEVPYEKILEETRTRYEVKEEKKDSLAVLVSADSISLQFINTDSVDSAWVMVIHDDSFKEDFLLYPGSSKSVRAKDNLKFTLGNSGVILLKLDNQQLDFEGRKGSVRHFEVNRKGIQRLNSPPIIKIE
jgi:transcriptional regulator with XRE-family HTH domain